MDNFNFEIQLVAFCEQRLANKELKPHHISLYLSLLMKWRKQNNMQAIFITSYEMMQQSNLGSRRTYFRYMQDLVKWGYIAAYRKGANGAYVVMAFLYPKVEI